MIPIPFRRALRAGAFAATFALAAKEGAILAAAHLSFPGVGHCAPLARRGSGCR